MQTYLLEGRLTALTSISHIGETRGIEALLRREKLVAANGSDVDDIPVITGNSIRGRLRDLGMLHMCRALGYGVQENLETNEMKIDGLSLAAFYFLFSGGQLTKDANKSLDIDMARRLRDAIPLISIFGGANGNQMLQGKLKCGKIIPICSETAHLLPERFTQSFSDEENGAMSLSSVWSFVQKERYVRMDDEKKDGLRMLIAPEVRAQVEAKSSTKLAKRQHGEEDVDTEIGTHQQMMMYVETFAAGTQFFWEIILDDVTDVEFEAFMICLVEFARRPFIGGKSSIGHGKVKIQFADWINIDPLLAPTGQKLDRPIGIKYIAHLNNKTAEIKSELAKIL